MNTLIVFVKAPTPGKVKTRLSPPLSPDQAANLYAAFVKDTLQTANKVSEARVEIAYDPGDTVAELNWIDPPTPPPFFLQQGADLGARLTHAFTLAFENGSRKIIVIGSDTPHLDLSILESAFVILDQKEAVLGPAEDGGYYLIGLRQPNAFLFNNVPWSSDRVFLETLGRIQRSGLSFGLITPQSDIDTVADLKRLMERLDASATPTCSTTRRVLKNLQLELYPAQV